jgi:hypothetical protein
MLQRDPQLSSRPPTFPISSGGAGGGLYFSVCGLLVALLAVGYILIGMPGLHSDLASAPDRSVTTQQPAPPADHP